MKPNTTDGVAPAPAVPAAKRGYWRKGTGADGYPEWIFLKDGGTPEAVVWRNQDGTWGSTGGLKGYKTPEEAMHAVENYLMGFAAPAAPAGIVGEWAKELRDGREHWVFWDQKGTRRSTVIQWESGIWSTDAGTRHETREDALGAAERRRGLLLRYAVTPATPAAGIKYDDTKPRWDLVPWESMIPVVSVLTSGAQKYAPDNWRKVPDARSRYFAAALRHMTAWWGGEINDPETGQHHLAHAACCLLFLIALEGKS